jgi:hypothetical protein
MGLIRDLLGFGASSASTEDIQKWAKEHGYALSEGSRNAQGPQISGDSAGIGWRIEWGAPSRDYIPNTELRAKAEYGQDFKPYGLLASRRLYEALQQRAFSIFTDSLQTMPGTNLPEELRWVSVLQEYPGFDPSLRAQLAVAGTPPLVFNRYWDALAEEWMLSQTLREWEGTRNPLIVMAMRGKLYFRMSVEGPTIDELNIAKVLLDRACKHLPILAKGG